MQKRFIGISLLIGSCLLLSTLPANAGVVAFSDRASYLASLPKSGVDNLGDNPINQASPTQIRNAGSFSYIASVSASDPTLDNFFTSSGGVSEWLSPTNANDNLSFAGFSPSVNAIGAYVFGVDDGFTPIAGQRLNLVAVDAAGSHGFAFASDGSNSFFGVVSTEPLLSLSVGIANPDGSAWVVANEVVLGSNWVSAVPEPNSACLLVLGVAAQALYLRRNASARQVLSPVEA